MLPGFQVYVVAPFALNVAIDPIQITDGIAMAFIFTSITVNEGAVVALFIVIHSGLTEVTVPPKGAIFVAVITPDKTIDAVPFGGRLNTDQIGEK